MSYRRRDSSCFNTLTSSWRICIFVI